MNLIGILAFILAASIPDVTSTPNNTVWSDVQKIITYLMEKCIFDEDAFYNRLDEEDNAAVILKDCLSRQGLQVLDRALKRDVIQISHNVVLVKWKNETDSPWLEKNRQARNSHRSDAKRYAEASSHQSELIEKAARFLKTRLLKVSFKGFKSTSIISSEGRGRKNNMLGQMLMFGLVAAGFIVIPLGFQFLAVLGGKALLLAKLALLLTSIQGLKKIATSHVNYGLYTTGPWHYDRRWQYESDPYSTGLYSSAGPTGELQPLVERTLPSSILPTGYNILAPREDEQILNY
ncbi:uncharacterized protein LOC126742659 [Anthonomus grandis grandis]|uniref:uncharacterized protein LOC126742659 n=1 Tax=Anthonomus grandis grandis TaxID=2921223 RepID=UPI002166322F|nr:uncharacterized protein LOC126742659 [Anthonomus grandis grandis]